MYAFSQNLTRIDLNRTEQIIVKAVQEGVNYFDTAYMYGGSEDVLGQILAKNNLRDLPPLRSSQKFEQNANAVKRTDLSEQRNGLRKSEDRKQKAWMWANTRKGCWHTANSFILTTSVTNDRLRQAGYVFLSDIYVKRHRK